MFNLYIIEKNIMQFKEDLETLLQLKLSKYYVKAPDPNTVLGRFVETIRFTGAYLESSDNWIDRLDFGIGETGYYYDVRFKRRDYEIDEFTSYLIASENKMKDLESKIETLLDNYYFKIPQLKIPQSKIPQSNITQSKIPQSNESNQSYSISNFDFTIDSIDFLSKLLKIPMLNIADLIHQSSDPIILSYSNVIQTSIRFNLFSLLQFTNPNQFILEDKFLEGGRFMTIENQINDVNHWRIYSRGVPISVIIQIFKPSSTNSNQIQLNEKPNNENLPLVSEIKNPKKRSSKNAN